MEPYFIHQELIRILVIIRPLTKLTLYHSKVLIQNNLAFNNIYSLDTFFLLFSYILVVCTASVVHSLFNLIVLATRIL